MNIEEYLFDHFARRDIGYFGINVFPSVLGI